MLYYRSKLKIYSKKMYDIKKKLKIFKLFNFYIAFWKYFLYDKEKKKGLLCGILFVF